MSLYEVLKIIRVHGIIIKVHEWAAKSGKRSIIKVHEMHLAVIT